MSLRSKYSPDDMVWVHVSKSYGWWPAQVQNIKEKAGIERTISQELGKDFLEPKSANDEIIYVKFFDDDNKEWYPVFDARRIQKYSCKDKLKFIKTGFKNLDETKKDGLGGVNLRLAQFYKDVELAEVLTDNDPRVGDVLATYEVAENDENTQQEQEEIIPQADDQPAPSKGKKASKNVKKKSENVLKEIKNGGGVSKKSKSKGKLVKGARKEC